jgi:hypothetical protein
MDNEQNLAGLLSNGHDLKNSTQIGHHSRFLLKKNIKLKQINSTLVINGPATYSRYLIQYFMDQLKSNHIEYVVGGEHVKILLERIETRAVFIPNTNMSKADEVLCMSNEICGYFGYSTLMDCKVLNCSFNLIPTPGQSEQIYLAELHKKSP